MPDTWHAVYRTADGALLSTTTVLPSPLPAGTASVPLAGPIGPGDRWDAATHAVVPADVAEGLPRGALNYVLDAADPLGMPVDAQPAGAPAPAGTTLAPVRVRPEAHYEWDPDAQDFGPPTALGDRILHDPTLALMRDAQAAQWVADRLAATGAPAALAAEAQAVADRTLRKVRLLLRARLLAG